MTTVPPEPFTLSYSRCIVRRRRATSFSSYTCAASTNMEEMSFSTSANTIRAFFSRSAWASVDMTSCSSWGITMSRISTDSTVMPHSDVRSSMTSCNS